MQDGEIPFRCRAVGVTVLKGSGGAARVLLLKRAKGIFAGLWCQVTGRIETGEMGYEAAVREVIEETGLSSGKLYTADFCDFFYNPVVNVIEAIPMFVAVVEENAQVRLNDENTEYRWAEIHEAGQIVPFLGHRSVLNEIRRDFIETEPMLWKLIKEY